MKFIILSEGRENSDPIAPLVADYIGRLKKFISTDDIVVRPGAKNGLVEKTFQLQKNGSFVVTLDERGKQFTSIAFCSRVQKWTVLPNPSVAFIIGGAEGLPPEIRSMSNQTIALSNMTLPHRFARLILAEQLYRAKCIEKNIPYHK